MPLDAICLRAVLHELRPQLIGARIDKVQQGNLRLLLNAGANQPRIQLTNILRDNPAQPPMFCMLLRKHLVGARVLSIEQPDLERMVILTLQCTDEFGEISQKQLVLECMGRRSNLVLLDAQGRIVECLRRVDADLSATRQLLPGLFYHLPTPLDKLSLLSQEEDSLALAQRGGDAEQAVDKWVLDHYTGISPLIAREFAFRAGHETDVRFGALNDTQRGALVQEFSDTANAVKEDNYMPVILYRDGKPVDFTYRPIAQYGAETQVETRESFSQMLDEFYDARERQELSARRGYTVTGVDYSPEMLAQAQQKLAAINSPPLLLCQSMPQLRLLDSVDAAICCLDSINYLTRPRDVQRTFNRLHDTIAPGGSLVFDVHAVSKMEKLDGEVLLDEREDVFCLWRTRYRKNVKMLDYEVDLFRLQPDGAWERDFEEHHQRAYTVEELTAWLEEAGFTAIRTHGELKLRRANERDGRIYFSCIRK